MEVQAIGVDWEVNDFVEIGLFSYDYEQEKASEDIRDVSIEADPTGASKDLGSEIDLILTLLPIEDLEVLLIVGEFEAGKAYGPRDGETSRFLKLEVTWDF